MITRSWCCHSQAYLVMIGIACSEVPMMFQSCSKFPLPETLLLHGLAVSDWNINKRSHWPRLWIYLNRRGRALQRKTPSARPKTVLFMRNSDHALIPSQPRIELSSRTPSQKFSGHRADSAWKGNSQMRFYCWLMGFANLRNNRTKLSNCTFYFVSYDCKMYGFISFGNNL